MAVNLYDYQIAAVESMHNGCILCGGVGSGKSRTAIAYYYDLCGGCIYPMKENPDNIDSYVKMNNPIDLYIITTARKRDTMEWENDLAPFMIFTDNSKLYPGLNVTIDSWNNIGKYVNISDAFFIFDEQRVVGKGEWTKSFLKITKSNKWILLSATPGDKWEDYIPVFMANGFYESRTQFNREHVVFSPYITKFPKIDRYLNTRKLERLRDILLVDMEFERKTVAHHENIVVDYNASEYKKVFKDRWDIFKDAPIENASELCYCLRKIVNSDVSRLLAAHQVFMKHKKLIVFYNFDYELALLKSVKWGDAEIAEWNGHKHQPIPFGSDSWVYLVNYNAGAEGWNCILTDTILFYSQNYSYKTMVQSEGRIARLNSPFRDLYYYHLISKSSIDIAIGETLRNKKKFNEGAFAGMKTK